MHFSSPINRPPMEADSFFLQVTQGCSHNVCKFCVSFKEAPFELTPFEDIEKDLADQAKIPYLDPPKRMFLQGANSLVRSYDDLMRIAELVHQYLPSIETIGGWARVDDLCDKTVEQLKSLQEAGYNSFYFGFETGDDDLLALHNKGYDSALALEQGLKLHESGFPYAATYVTGMGGAGYGNKSALATAELFNKIQPQMILAHSLMVIRDTFLMDDVKAGKFTEAGEMERIEEMIDFLEALDIETIFHADNITFPYGVKGILPDHKDKILEGYHRILLDETGEHKMRAHREWATTAMHPLYAKNRPLSKNIF